MEEQLIGPIQERWLQSLEQHPERQGKGNLGIRKEEDANEYRSCCLGELAVIARIGDWIDNRLVVGGSRGCLRGYHSQVGLYSTLGEKGNDLYSGVDSLSRLNDSGKTWPEIAAIIRANPKAYLAKPV